MTDNITTKSHKPDFYAYIVEDGGEGKKAFWTKVGIAYRNKDGKGLNLQLIAHPIDGKLTLREPAAVEGAHEGEQV